MDIYALPDKAIQKELGNRFRALRLRRNITQKELSEATTLSLNVIKALESGKGKLSSIIAVLRELEALDQLHDFIPEPEVSPLQLARMQGKTRKRATGSRGKQARASTGDRASDDPGSAQSEPAPPAGAPPDGGDEAVAQEEESPAADGDDVPWDEEEKAVEEPADAEPEKGSPETDGDDDDGQKDFGW